MMELPLAMREDMKAWRKQMDAWVRDINGTRGEKMACQGKAEAHLEGEEPTSVDMEPEAAHGEVPREDAAVMPVGEPKKRRRDRNLDARCLRKRQKGTQGKNGCRRNSVAASRGTTRRAVVARRR
jgi:hypothetical protein